MSVKTIKNVDEEKWFALKAMASENDVPVGKMLEKLVDFYREESTTFWDRILKTKRILSDKEASDMEMISKKSRAEKWSRA